MSLAGHIGNRAVAGLHRASVIGEFAPVYEREELVKITNIGTVVVNARMRNWVFVKVETDEGITGWGEASLEWKTRGVVGCVEDLAPLIIGQDPRRIEHLYQIMYRQGFFRLGAVGMSALSGIEQALWDISGKALGVPVYQLLGGAVRERIRMYDHLGGGEMTSLYLDDQPEQMAERARESISAGYTAVKILAVPRSEPLEGTKPLRRAERVMQAVREAVGPDVDIMVDFHGRTWPEVAIQYAKVLEPFRPFFIEEVCPPENIAGMTQVARATSIPLATGERLIGRAGFREVFEQRAVAVIQPDICHTGGLWETRKIAAMAETYFMSVAPHNPLGPLATAAAIHFAAATPNWIIQESFRADVPWRDDVLINPMRIEGGYVALPDGPGFGVAVNEAEAMKHPFQQEEVLRYFHPDGAVADW